MVSDSKKTASGPRLPVAQLTILSICRFAEPVALTGVYPYLPEMIESFNVPQNEVAKWAGIISAVFSVSQCLTAIPWGRASDKFGRKPVILTAMACAMTSSLLFGFSKNIAWAIFARAMSGASNGNVGILRTTVAEIVPQKSLQPRAFSTLPLVWQIGSILGPILGGALASPAAKLPGIFGNSKFFKTFPFALPNLVNGIIFTIGMVIGILFLRESLETKKYNRDWGRDLGKSIVRCFTKRKPISSPLGDYESLDSKRPRKPSAAAVPLTYKDIFTPNCSMILAAYFVLAFHGVAYDQLLPVFMHLPVNREHVHLPLRFTGGFGLESGRIGVLFTIYGIFSMVAQFTIFPSVTAKYGPLRCMRICTLLFPIAYMITPYAVLMPTPFLQQVTILAIMLFKSMAGVFAFPCLTILLTNSAKSLQLLGTINGVATSIAAIGRAFGPYTAGRTLTWSIDAGYGVSAWWYLALASIPGHIITYWIEDGPGFNQEEKEVGQFRETISLDGRVVASQSIDRDEAAAGLLDTDSENEDDEMDDRSDQAKETFLRNGQKEWDS
jgi:MFS family permease